MIPRSQDEIYNLRKRVDALEAECLHLKKENTRLKKQLGGSSDSKPALKSMDSVSIGVVTQSSPVEEKIVLFRKLFRGREDIYPVRWESTKEASGYSPACASEWDPQFCGKPKIKCAKCRHRKLMPVTDKVIFDRLSGKHIVGVYPLLQDETCWFLAVDFDKTMWQQDSSAFLDTCNELEIAAALERSRSGNGGHIWIFFAHPIPATLARKLGSAIMTRTMQRRPEIGLDSYDRFFPSQDRMPKGGFGNLIALPLQKVPRDHGNSVFLDGNLMPWPDQWLYLSGIATVSRYFVEHTVSEAESLGDVLGVQRSLNDDDEEGGGDAEDPWTLPPSGGIRDPQITGTLPETVKVIHSNQVFVEKRGLPSAMVNRLIRLAAFQNPEFYKAEALRLPTFNKPRIIACAEEYKPYIGLPRGCLEQALDLFRQQGIRVEMKDERYSGKRISSKFHGKLRPEQEEAVKILRQEDIGLPTAATAFVKIVVAAWMIAERQVNTLILVHRKQLMDQWRERLSLFLEIPVNEIGRSFRLFKTLRIHSSWIMVCPTGSKKLCYRQPEQEIAKRSRVKYAGVVNRREICHALSNPYRVSELARSIHLTLRRAVGGIVEGVPSNPGRAPGVGCQLYDRGFRLVPGV